MKMRTVEPGDLLPNPWNSNRLTPEAELKLRNSITRHGVFKPVVVRTLEDGRLQILGGQHRAEAANFLGIKMPVVDLGAVDDVRAKEIGIIDNGRYGYDEADRLAELLAELGDPADLAAFMPFDLAEIDAMSAITKIDLDSLELDAEDAAPVETREKAPRTQAVFKFKVPIEDQSFVESAIKGVIFDQAIEDNDSLVKAGEALIWLLRQHESGK